MLLKPLQNVLRSPLREVLLTEESDLALHAFGVWGVKLKSLVRGQGSATFTRTTEGSITDFEGLVQTGLAEEMRFELARRVENYLNDTEDFTQSSWNERETAAILAPDTISLPAEGDYVDQIITKDWVVGDAFVCRIGLKGTGTTTLRLARSGAGVFEETRQQVALTSNYRVYSVSHTLANDQTAIRVDILRGVVDTAETVKARRAQLESVTGQADQNPSEYVSVDVGNDPELIANGNFDTDTDGWTSESGTVSLVSGRGRMTNTEGTYSHITYTQNLRAGRYLLKGTLRKVAGNNTTGIRVGTDKTAAETTLISSPCIGELGRDLANIANATDLSLSFDFIVPSGGSTVYIVGMNNGSTVGEYIEIDDVSVKDFVFPSYADGVRSFAYENGNTVDGDGVVTEAKGADLTTEWGALFEPASPNVLTQSEDFTTGGGDWSVGTGDIETVETSTLSVLQGKNWWKLQAVAGGVHSSRYIFSSIYTKSAAAEQWTYTIYASKDDVDWLQIRLQNTSGTKYAGMYFNLATGTVGSSSEATWTVDNSEIELVKTGIYRLRVTTTTDTDTTLRGIVWLAGGDLNNSTNLSASDGTLIQAGQIEKAAVRTSYIPTNGTAVTRTVDDGSGMFNLEGNLDQRKGSLVVDLRWTSNYDAVQDGTESILSLTTFPNDLLYFFSLPGDHRLTSVDGTNICKKALQFVAGKTYRIGLTWSSANGINLSWRNVTDSGTWQVWANTPFDGAYRTSGDYIRVCVPADVLAGLKRPTRIRDLRIWLQDKTTTWVEANY